MSNKENIPEVISAGMSIDKKLIKRFAKMLQGDDLSKTKRMWIYGDKAAVYIRLSERYNNKCESLPTIDFAATEIEAQAQSKGLKRALFAVAKLYSKRRQIFCECVNNPRYEQFFIARPKIWTPDDHSPRCYFANLDELSFDSLLPTVK